MKSPVLTTEGCVTTFDEVASLSFIRRGLEGGVAVDGITGAFNVSVKVLSPDDSQVGICLFEFTCQGDMGTILLPAFFFGAF